jgi:uncharacterized protein (DUF1015 family)
MAEIRPFAALHYNLDKFGRDVSSLIAPPYDVLSEQMFSRFAGQNERNIVHVDLPYFPPGSAGPDAVYMAADRKLRDWLGDKTLVQDVSPRYYAYHQDFSYAGGKYSRLCVFAVLRLSPFGTGQVFPHEQTFGGPIADRLKLMQATSCQLSPIFGLVQLPLHKMLAALPMERQAAFRADLDGVHHEVTPMSQPAAVAELGKALAPLPVYIADGHHRYKTALAYRDWLVQKMGTLPADHPANFVMLGLMSMEDPGNLVLPTHRIVEGLSPSRLAKLRESSKAMLQWYNLGKVSPQTAEKQLAARKDKAFVFVTADPAEAWMASLTVEQLPAAYAADRTPAFRGLALAILHKWLIEAVLDKDGSDPVKIRYTHDTAEACAAAGATTTAILVQACAMKELMAVCDANDTMPQKSTYFYPKLGTGLVLHSLEA